MQHQGNVYFAAFDPKGERVVTASDDKTARIWDARTGKPIGKPLQHQGAVVSAAFDLKGERVVTASQDKTARIWDAPQTGEKLLNQVRSTLGRNAPEPLKLLESTKRRQDFMDTMVNGFGIVWMWALKTAGL